MPSEPDHKMDELLRTYARKRRDDAGTQPELHPATRRLLQAEAAKLAPRPSTRRSPWLWIVASWPRVAISTGVFSILALVLWNTLPHRDNSPENSHPHMLLALDKRVDPSASAPKPAAMDENRSFAKTEAANPPVHLADRSKDQSLNFDSKPPAVAVPFGTAVTNGALSVAAKNGGRLEVNRRPLPILKTPRETEMLLAQENSPRPNPTATLAPPVQPPPALALTPQPAAPRGRPPAASATAAKTTRSALAASGTSAGESRPSGISRTRFTRQPESLALSKTKSTTTSPLSTFDFELSGNEVRLIDEDGSVYAGPRLNPEDETRLGEVEAKDKTREAQRSLATTPQGRVAPSPNVNVTFRVVGTNRTMRQRITFEGTFASIPPANSPIDRFGGGAAPPPQPGAPSTAKAFKSTPTPAFSDSDAFPFNASNSPRLTGQLRIGTSDAVTIIALPAGE